MPVYKVMVDRGGGGREAARITVNGKAVVWAGQMEIIGEIKRLMKKKNMDPADPLGVEAIQPWVSGAYMWMVKEDT